MSRRPLSRTLSMLAASLLAAGAARADPLRCEQRELVPTPAATGAYGTAVALSASTAVVGDYLDDAGGLDSGAAFVFDRNLGGPGTWGQAAKIHRPPFADGVNFAFSVAISGDTLVAGAPGDGQDGFKAGAAHVHRRNQGGSSSWGEVVKLGPADPASSTQFGSTVAIDADTIAVGRPFDSSLLGAVYVFSRNEGGPDQWGQVKKLTASDGTLGDNFGTALAIDGDTLVVGTHKIGGNSGAVYVFERDVPSLGSWGETRIVPAPTPNDAFGFAVALDGDRLVVGSPWYDVTVGNDNTGIAHVFERDAGGAGQWGLVGPLTPDDPGDREAFGKAVAVAGDVAYGGEPDANSGGLPGTAYAFVRDSGGPDAWGQVRRALEAPTPFGFDDYGGDLAADGQTLVVGAGGADDAYVVACAPRDLYAVDGSSATPNLYRLDATTGAVFEVVGPTEVPYVSGIDFDPADGTLYGVTSASFPQGLAWLLRIDTSTGEATALGNSLGLGADLVDIGFDPSAAPPVLYGWQQNANASLYTIDLSFGSAGSEQSCCGSTAAGIAFDDSGQLYLKSLDGSLESEFFEIDATDGSIDVQYTDKAGTLDAALTFDDEGTAYAFQTTGGGASIYAITLPALPTDPITQTLLGSNALADLTALAILPEVPDGDGDGVPDGADVCPSVPDPGQEDADGSGIGDACNGAIDPDGDEYEEPAPDNCDGVPNPTQSDVDNDSLGDACDPDIDDDADLNGADNCPFWSNPNQIDTDGDTIGDGCDSEPNPVLLVDVETDDNQTTDPPDYRWSICTVPDGCFPDYPAVPDKEVYGLIWCEMVENPGNLEFPVSVDMRFVDLPAPELFLECCATVQHCDDADELGCDNNRCENGEVCPSIDSIPPNPPECCFDGQADLFALERGPEAGEPGTKSYPDTDGDILPDGCDNCPTVSNESQGDCDCNGVGDACDPTSPTDIDSDCDGLGDACDNFTNPTPGPHCPAPIPCPEPGVGVMLAAGIAGLSLLARRRARRS